MLWVAASLLTLVEDVFSEEDSQEAQPDVLPALRQPSWPPDRNELGQESAALPSWPDAFGESLLHVASYGSTLQTAHFKAEAKMVC